MHSAIHAYLLAALLFWSPPAKTQAPWGELEEAARQRYAEIAADIVSVAFDDEEAPLFVGTSGRAVSALLLAKLAHLEGGLWLPVDDGRCNQRVWRHGNALCDSGVAASLWQVHPEMGLALDGDGYSYTPRGFQIRDLVGSANRPRAARIALHMLRTSYRVTKSLCGYTGERRPCPKAQERAEGVRTYLKENPPPLDLDQP